MLFFVLVIVSGALAPGCGNSLPATDGDEDRELVDGDTDAQLPDWCRDWQTEAKVQTERFETEMRITVTGPLPVQTDSILLDNRFCFRDFPQVCNDMTVSPLALSDDGSSLYFTWDTTKDLPDFLLPISATLRARDAVSGASCGTVSFDTPEMSAPFVTQSLNSATRLDTDRATYATSDFPRIITDTSGHTLLAWRDNRLGYPHLFAALLNPDGTARTDQDIQIDADIPGVMESVVSLAADPAGGLAAAWRFRSPDGSAGIAVAFIETEPSFSVTTRSVVLDSRDASFRNLVLSANSGYIAVAWVSADDRIQAYVVKPGLRDVSEMDRSDLSLPRFAKESAPTLSFASNGELLLAWGLEQNGCSLRVTRYSAQTGDRISDIQEIETVEPSSESASLCAALPRLAPLGLHDHALVYTSFDPARPGLRLSLSREGETFDQPITITETSAVPRGQVEAQRLADGGVALVWMDARNNDVYDLYTMRLDRDGAPIAVEQRVNESESERMSYSPRLSCQNLRCSFLWYDVDPTTDTDRIIVRTQRGGLWSPVAELAQLPRGYANGSYDITYSDTAPIAVFHDYRHYSASIAVRSDSKKNWLPPQGREPGLTLINNGHSSLLDASLVGDRLAVAFSSRAVDHSIGQVLIRNSKETPILLPVSTSDDFILRRMRIAPASDDSDLIHILMEVEGDDVSTMVYYAAITPNQPVPQWHHLNDQDEADIPVRASEFSLVKSPDGPRLQAVWQDVRQSQVRLYARQLEDGRWADEQCLTCPVSDHDRDWSLRKWMMSQNGLLWIGDGSGLVSAFFRPSSGNNPDTPQILLGRLEDTVPDIALADDDPPLALLAWRDSNTHMSTLWAMRLSYDQDSLPLSVELSTEETDIQAPEIIHNNAGLWLASYWSVDAEAESATLKAVFSTDDAVHWSPSIDLPIVIDGSYATGLVSLCANSAGFVALVRRPDWYPSGYQIFSLQPLDDGTLRIGDPKPLTDGTIASAGSRLFCNPDLSVDVVLEAAPDGFYSLHRLHFP